MKKSTIILIVIVFAVSVFVVGIFGVRSVPYNERIYVTSITPTAITLSNDAVTKFEYNEKGYYEVDVPYEDGVVVVIDYEINPINATNKTLDISIDNLNKNSDAVIENGGIKFNNSGVVKVTYRVTDSPDGPSMVFYITPIVQK